MGATNGLVCVEAHIAQGSLGCHPSVATSGALGGGRLGGGRPEGGRLEGGRLEGSAAADSVRLNASQRINSFKGVHDLKGVQHSIGGSALVRGSGAEPLIKESSLPFTSFKESGGALLEDSIAQSADALKDSHTESGGAQKEITASVGVASFKESLPAVTTTTTTDNSCPQLPKFNVNPQPQSDGDTFGDEPTTSLDKLKLPIPMEVVKHGDSGNLLEVACEVNEAFSWDIPEGIGSSDYDSCCGDDLDIDEIDLEAKFLCKVHATLVHGKWLWCCCYYDIDGNYIQKRFDATSTSFDIAKALALECRRSAEANFHNIWIHRHKRYLEMQSIPLGIPESFSTMLGDIKHVFDPNGCNKCRMDRVQEILFQSLY